MSRLPTVGIIALSCAFLLASVYEPTPAEACGVKLVVKKKKKPRKKVASKSKKRIARSKANKNKRKRVRTKRDRQKVASGTRQARTGKARTKRRPVNTGRRKADVRKVATAEPAPVKPAPEPRPEPEPAVARVETEPKPRPEPRKKRRVRKAPVDAPAISVEVYFDNNSIAVDGDSQSSLAEVVTWLEENPRARLRVVGYADPKGSAAYNLRLSRQRAMAVRNYLSRTAKAPKRRMRVRARGESNLAYDADDPKNRRVVVRNR